VQGLACIGMHRRKGNNKANKAGQPRAPPKDHVVTFTPKTDDDEIRVLRELEELRQIDEQLDLLGLARVQIPKDGACLVCNVYYIKH